MRFLFDPIAGEGGGTTPPASPPAQQPPATPPVTPPQPTGVTLTAEQHRALLDAAAERDRLKTAEAEREAERQRRSEEEARKRGDFEKIIAERDKALAERAKQLADVEERSRKSELRRELAAAIDGAPVVKGWRPHLMKLWADQFEAKAAGDGWEVRSLDGKTSAEFVAAELAKPEFAHIVEAGTQGGAAAPGSTTGRPAVETQATGKGQEAVERWRRAKEEKARQGFGSIGLGPAAAS